MASCQFCVPWNVPLTMKAHTGAFGLSVGLPYDGWLWWHLHVRIHQVPSQWGGEIEAYASELRALDNPLIGGT